MGNGGVAVSCRGGHVGGMRRRISKAGRSCNDSKLIGVGELKILSYPSLTGCLLEYEALLMVETDKCVGVGLEHMSVVTVVSSEDSACVEEKSFQ